MITGYALILWLLGLFVLWRPIGGKFIVPILLIAYIAPFVAGPDRIARLGRIQSGRRWAQGRRTRRPAVREATDEERHPARGARARDATGRSPVTGAVALHGGGEFLPGDETFLRVLLERAAVRGSDPIRIAVVPTAAARGRPHLAAANGVVAFERVAAEMGVTVAAESVSVIDAASAADPALAARLAAADLIHLPGGDPDLVPTILRGFRGLDRDPRGTGRRRGPRGRERRRDGPGDVDLDDGGRDAGLGVVPGLLVVPHADAGRWASVLERFAGAGPGGLGALGLAERTGVVSDGEAIDGGGPLRWRVVGEGEVRWRPVEPDRPTLVLRDGDLLETPA